jgi:hypothetical protein
MLSVGVVMNKYGHYLSLGFNCELAFALQKSNIFEPTIFSWADIRGTDSLISGLLDSNGCLSETVKNYSANMFFCEKNKIGFHGKSKFSEMCLPDGSIDEGQVEKSLNETRARLSYLATKQDELILTNDSLIIFKWFHDVFEEKYTARESAEKIRDALTERYRQSKFSLLCVFESSENLENWDDGIISGRSLPKFSPRSNAKEIDEQSWSKLLSEFI